MAEYPDLENILADHFAHQAKLLAGMPQTPETQIALREAHKARIRTVANKLREGEGHGIDSNGASGD